MEPAVVSYIYSTVIPDTSFDFTVGIVKGDLSLKNFDIESFTFFDDSETVISLLKSQSVDVTMKDAGFVISADYEIKLLTYPYSDCGGIRISLEGVSTFTTLSLFAKPDSSDLSCCVESSEDDDDTCQSCGYIDFPQLDSLKLEIPYFDIEFIGDVNPIIEGLTDFLGSTLIPWFVSFFSQLAVDNINEELLGHDKSPHMRYSGSQIYYQQAGAPNIVISDEYVVLPYYCGYTIVVDNQYIDPNTNLDPFMAEADPSWYATFPEVLANTDFTFFFSPILIHSSWYTQLVTLRSHWYSNGSFTGTKNKLECVSARSGCTSSTMGPSDLSPLFESSTYASLGLTEISECDGCDLEIDWGFADPDLDPVFPEAPTVNVDGLTMIYPDLIVRVRGVDPDSGDNIFTKEFVTTLEFKGLYISDHAFINLIQGFQGVTSIAYNSDSSNEYSTYSNSSDLDSWSEIISITSSVYLQPFFSNYFAFNWAWYHNLPVEYMNGCLLKEEETFYSEDGWIAISANIDSCLCNHDSWRDDSARGDDGMCYCISQT
ncbi:hypothetical protein ADUPG1_005960 [Aduncisulcus paluster]|uniref:Uncharacterized protein n=1 Tax=Aduncisulcus paluster TaxID=2918883 RepID=A0ABQ5KG93_9EUKA|nr:hypothetical protein ADUPG1_005960 [Aduncisulcus paluster]